MFEGTDQAVNTEYILGSGKAGQIITAKRVQLKGQHTLDMIGTVARFFISFSK